MLTRQCLKFPSTLKILHYRKLSLNKKLVTPVLSSCRDLHVRCVQTYSTENKSDKTANRNEIFLSDGPLKDLKDKSCISSEELLEKMITGLSSDIHQKHRVYKNDLIRVINKIREIKYCSKKQSLLLIKCCTLLLPDETPGSRMTLLEDIWNTITPYTKFEVDHYNELLKVYIANNRTLSASQFVQQMGAVKPNLTTYELMLGALGEAGDVNQATEVISNMKAQGIPANENVFNSLILCQGKAGNLSSINEILTVMKSLKLEYSVDTYTAIARVYAWNKQNKLLLDEMEKAQLNGCDFLEFHILEIVKTLATVENFEPIPHVLQFLPEQVLKTPSITPYMQSVATQLVFHNQPLAALEIYKCLPLPSFGPKDDKGLHGRSLVRDCVKASLPSSVIALVTQELMSSGRNPIAIQNATEAALQLGKVPLALDMFTRMKQLGMPLRQHYFWPILLRTSNTYGEKGVMNTLSTMITMDVKPDYETIMQYTLPYVSFTSPQNLMKKFLETGLTVSTVLTPMMVTLLNTGQVRAASEICELFQGKVDVEKILKPLLKGFLMSSDLKCTVHILEDMTNKALDKNKDWVGRFLCEFVRHDNVKTELTDLLNVIKALKSTSINISTPAADYCITRLPEKYKSDVRDSFKDALIEITDEGLVDNGELFVSQVLHPKQMNEGSLKAHLNELEAKGMNTRGVLRKLLQQYCREGNLAAAREVVDKCQAEGVFLSAGMKASIFDLHVKLGELDMAEIVLAELNKSSPNFSLDEYKVIDFATLMVYRKQIEKAFHLIREQSKSRRVMGGRNISRNCWRLLDAVAAQGSPTDAQQMLELLADLRYCKPSNTLLGPLVRVHLKTNNLQQAVQEFVRLANKYNKTPLKHELLCKILTEMGEGKSEETFIINETANGKYNKLAQTILNIDKRVHGQGDVQLTLIAALAEVGYKKTLRKLFLDPSFKFHPDALLRHCERFADEKKVEALEIIVECAKDLRHVDTEEIYNMMLDVYQRDDNCQGALSLWYKMQESDITPSQKFVRNLCSLCKSNNKEIPTDLALLLDKQAKVAAKT